MRKILLSLFCLISISFADYIPYNDLISGKYKYSEKYGFSIDGSEEGVKIKQMIRILTKTTITKEPVKKVYSQYLVLPIKKNLYEELKRYDDYKDFLMADDYKYRYNLLIDIKYSSKIFRNLNNIYISSVNNPDFENGKEIKSLWLNQSPEVIDCGSNLSRVGIFYDDIPSYDRYGARGINYDRKYCEAFSLTGDLEPLFTTSK